LIDGLIGV